VTTPYQSNLAGYHGILFRVERKFLPRVRVHIKQERWVVVLGSSVLATDRVVIVRGTVAAVRDENTIDNMQDRNGYQI